MNNKVRIAIASVLLIAMFLPSLVLATAQEGDVLIFKGKEYFIHTNPLTPFLLENPGKLPKSAVISTSNWRGYIATWEVKENRFVLTDVTILRSKKSDQGGFSTEPFSVMSEIFP